jgi:probable O-glycosylation ligase (exosortase A-associated)
MASPVLTAAGDARPETAPESWPGSEWWRPRPSSGADRRPTSSVPRDAVATRDGRVPFVALLIFILILLLAPQAWFPILAPLRLALLAAGMAVAAHVLDRFLAGRPLTIVTREIVLAVCLGGWAVLTVPLSYWPGGSAAFLMGLFLKSLIIFWLVANLVSTQARLRAVALAFVIAGVPLAATAIDHFVSGDIVPGGGYRDVQRIVGYDAPLTQNPNDLALTLNLLLPFSVALLMRSRGALSRTLLAAIIALVSAAIVLTFSRAGFLTLAAILAFYLLQIYRSDRRGWAVAVVLLALLALPLLPGSYLGHMGTITDIHSDSSGSAQARWAGMVAAAKLAVTHPLIGAGAGMNLLALNEAQGPTWKEVHNVYLEYAVDLGMPGLLLFLALYWSSFAKVRSARRSAAGTPGLEDLLHYGGAVQASLIAFAVAGMFHPVGYHFYFYIIAGLAVALGTIRSAEAGPVAH